MSDRKLAKAVQHLFRQIRKLYRTVSKGMVAWLLRVAFISNRRVRRSTSGFVLPTTVFLILVVTLTTGALTYRAFTTSTRGISSTQSRVIYNAATPAIDRARAKLEFLFDGSKDNRFPGGVPSEEFLMSMLLNDGSTIKGKRARPLELPGNTDPYTLAGEKRVDINGDTQNDNAWTYRADTDGDGSDDATVVYSVIFSTPPDTNVPGAIQLVGLTDQQKADGAVDPSGSNGRIVSYARGGPLSNTTASSCVIQDNADPGSTVESGWYADQTNTSTLRKNFQVDAFVIPDQAAIPGGTANFSTLEFSQDRQLERGNKWGAWFRNDLEIFPGAPFQWNGAMHTEGSLYIGRNSNGSFSAFLISSPSSCLYTPATSSEISVTNKDTFKGIIASGQVGSNNYGDESTIYFQNNPNDRTFSSATLSTGSDWATQANSPFATSLDPAAILQNDGYRARGGDSTNSGDYDPNRQFGERFQSKSERAPYVDDLYRADDRYGPKQKYNEDPVNGLIPSGSNVGDTIPDTNTLLRSVSPAAGEDAGAVGLDGYWERRARNEGLRILVGQRLELGNTNGWVAPQDRPDALPTTTLPYLATTTLVAGDGIPNDLRTTTYTAATDASTADPDKSDVEGDPLNPPYLLPGTRAHEAKQRRALRDNIAAVQSAAVYHAATASADEPTARDYPIACFASTAHPGSALTLKRSANFMPTYFVDSSADAAHIDPDPRSAATFASSGLTSGALLTDFFNGRGTNGWEFAPMSRAQFETDVATPTSSLRIALQNLAQFAGDYNSATGVGGAYPPTQEANQIHPDPEMTMWGNFSNLRRSLALLDAGSYANLSIADKTYLQTAACTVGMLAYNIDQVQRFDPRNPANDSAGTVTALAQDLYKLMDGEVSAASPEVLPETRLSTYDYGNAPFAAASRPAKYNPRDYDRVPAEAYLAKLRDLYGGNTNEPKYRLAELIFTHFQVRRDRTYGFRESPAANTWNYNPYVTVAFGEAIPSAMASGGKVNLWSSACDPNLFALTSAPLTRKTGALQNDPDSPTFVAANQYRLALSRLCGTVIPSGAVHDFPGDNNYPVRSRDTSTLPVPLPTRSYLPELGGAILPDPAGDVASPNTDFQWDGTPYAPGTSNPLPYANKPPYVLASVTPKWPSLYYLFPEFEHTQLGSVEDTEGDGAGLLPSNIDDDWGDDVDHRQPNGILPIPGTADPLWIAFQPWAEPYVTDNYINTLNSAVRYRPVVASVAANVVAPSDTPTPQPDPVTPIDVGYGLTAAEADTITFARPDIPTPAVRLRYRTFGNPMPDYSVRSVALQPSRGPGVTPAAMATSPAWVLPFGTPADQPRNISPNRIIPPHDGTGSTPPAPVAIPFFDRVLFNGREWLPTRVLDIDLGLLRTNAPASQPGNTAAYQDAWLPLSGIVYAFREDAVREDAILRPANATACPDSTAGCTNATNPSNSTDPALGSQRISLKQVDFVPDPDRRPYGFRLRNGSQLKRANALGIPAKNNITGLSFFTDNPVYVQGDYNLHEKIAGEDGGTAGERLEEFTQKLPDNDNYTEDQFYDQRTTRDANFADPDLDRWRPSEILGDVVTFLSENFCDGSMIDTFASAGTNSTASVNAAVYNDTANGLYEPGCANSDGQTSFLNQNRPNALPIANWTWLRENAIDSSLDTAAAISPNTSPVKISRNGNGVVVPPVTALDPAAVTSSAPADLLKKENQRRPKAFADTTAGYFTADERARQPGSPTRVNSIIVSGIPPSRQGQSYGGLHNFPRFLQDWQRPGFTPFWFAGSLLQLNFANYATSPYDLDAWEPNATPSTSAEVTEYYKAPKRLWGYDVALQFAPAGPAAARFVTASKLRNEFYNELPATDPYIRKLCQAMKTPANQPANLPTNVSLTNLRCPS